MHNARHLSSSKSIVFFGVRPEPREKTALPFQAQRVLWRDRSRAATLAASFGNHFEIVGFQHRRVDIIAVRGRRIVDRLIESADAYGVTELRDHTGNIVV